MTDNERIHQIYCMYCESISNKHEAYDFLREHRSWMSKDEVELFEETMTKERMRQKVLEDICADLYGIDLWHMWLDEPLPEKYLMSRDVRKAKYLSQTD